MNKEFGVNKILTILISIFTLAILLTSGSTTSLANPQSDDDVESEVSAVNSQCDLLLKVDDVEYYSNFDRCNMNPIIEHDGDLYLMFSWWNGSAITLSVISSSDDGETWTSKVDMWSSTYYINSIWFELYVWKGDIYAFYSGFTNSHASRRVFMKKAPLTSWQDLNNASQVTIRSSEGYSWDLASDDDYIYMTMTQGSQWRTVFYRYDGSSWSSGRYLSSVGSTYYSTITALNTSSGTKLVMTYSRPYTAGYSSGYVNIRTSTDSGSSWTSSRVIMNSHRYYMSLNMENINGTLIQFASRITNQLVQISISRDEGQTWTNEMDVLTSRGMASQTSRKCGFSVGMKDNGRIIYLLYEGNPEEIRMIYSQDWGSNWISENDEIVLQNSTSYDPVITDNARFVSYMRPNGSEYNLEVMDINDLYLDDSSPKNLTISRSYMHFNLSWEPPKQDVFNKYDFLNYSIYRGTSMYNMSHYRTLGNVTWFNDTIYSFGSDTYYYAVSATFNTIGESSWSNMVFSEVLLPPPIDGLIAIPGDLKVDLSWNPIIPEVRGTLDVSHISLYRGRYYDSMHPYFELDVNDITFTDDTVSYFPSGYYYKITYHISGIGEVNPSNYAYARPFTFPSSPVDISIEEMDRGVSIKWVEPEDLGGYSIESYQIYRGSSPDNMKNVEMIRSPALQYDEYNMTFGESSIFQIAAKNRLGESIRSSPILVDYQTTPTIPTVFEISEEDSLATLTWNPPEIDWGKEIEGYRIYRSVGAEPMILWYEVDSKSRSFSDPVSNGMEYNYWISAVNEFGEGRLAGPRSVICSTIPGSISDLSVVLGDGYVGLSWADVVDDGGAPVISYRIYRSIEPGVRDYLTTVSGGSNFFKDNGLENGVTYHYWVSALNIKGEGPAFGPIQATPGDEPGRISEISIFPGLFSAKLLWTPPDNGGYPVSSYNVYRGRSPHSLEFHISIPIKEYDIDYIDVDLEYGETYYYGVTSTNEWGESYLTAILPVKPFGLSDPPSINNIRCELTSLTITLTPPGDLGGGTFDRNVIYYKTSNSQIWDTIESKTGQITLQGLITGIPYELRVLCKTQFGNGTMSDIIKATPGDVPSSMVDLEIETDDHIITLKWSEPENNGYPIEGYYILSWDEMGEPLVLAKLGPDARSFEFTGLENGREYNLWTYAFNSMGDGVKSNTVSGIPLSVPDMISDIWITEAYMGEVLIKWNEPIDNGGSNVISYNLYRRIPGSDFSLVANILNKHSYRDTDLENGVRYDYVISAVSDFGEGSLSIPIQVIPYGIPSAVNELESDVTTDSVKLKWMPPSDDGGSSVIGYAVYKGTNPVNMKLWRTVDPTTLEVVDEDVEDGTYFYSIIPMNSVGSGDHRVIEVEVPPRIPTALILGISSFMIPLVLVMLIILIPLLMKKSREKKEEKETMEKEAKDAIISRTIDPNLGLRGPSMPPLPPLHRPPPALSPMGAPQRPSNVLPPLRTAPTPVRDDILASDNVAPPQMDDPVQTASSPQKMRVEPTVEESGPNVPVSVGPTSEENPDKETPQKI